MKLKKKEKPERIVVSGYVEEATRDKIDALAAESKMSRSEAIEALIEESLENRKLGRKKKASKKAKKK